MVQPRTREVAIGTAELMALIGLPARLLGRLPLSPRYLWGGFHILSPVTIAYAEDRWAKWYKLRLWLMPDIKELELLEELINRGSNQKIAAFRQSQLSLCGLIGITGALIAQMTITALQLPRLEQVHYTARGFFITSLVMSFLGTYNACVQQRSLVLATEPDAVRAWLSMGCKHRDEKGNARLRSSLIAQIIIAAPFEFVSIAVVLLLLGLGVYLGSAMTKQLGLSPGTGSDKAILITFIVVVLFPMLVFAQALGGKDLEEIKSQESRTPYPVENLETPPETDEKLPDEEIALSLVGPEHGRTARRPAKRDDDMELTQALRDASAAHRECARVNEKLALYYDSVSEPKMLKRHL